MGGKKKSAIPMTEEERIVFSEEQRLLQDETRKRKEDIISQFLRDKLMHEERATHYNMYKLNLQWKEILRVAKAKELRKDIEILSQAFERVVDRKDMVMKELAKEMVEAEEMYAMALRSHIQTVDYLLGNK